MGIYNNRLWGSKSFGFRHVLAFFNQKVNKTQNIFLLFYLIIVLTFEFLSYTYQGFFVIITSRLWLVTGIIFFLYILILFIKNLVDEITKRNIILAGGMILLLLYLFAYVGNLDFADINPDSTQQLTAGVNSFKNADWNFTGTSFLGYPHRQYLINALPTLLFGQSIYSLHLGFALPFIIGIIVMYLGLCSFLQSRECKRCYALIPLYSIIGFPLVMEYYLNFEQAITPISLTMIGIGLFLNFMSSPNLTNLIFISWLGSYCAGSYTPVWASLGLLLVFLCLSICNNTYIKDNSRYIKASTVYVIVFILFNTALILINSKTEKMLEFRKVNIISFSKDCIIEFLLDKNVIFFGAFAIFVLVYLLLSLLLQLKFYNFVIALWIFAVVILSNYMEGYTAYSKAWIIQRALIVIPVILIGIFTTILPILKNFSDKKLNIILSAYLLVLIIIGSNNSLQMHNSFTYFRFVQPMKYMLATVNKELEKQGMNAFQEFNLILYTENLLQTNLEDYTGYLYPYANIIVKHNDNTPIDMDLTLPIFIFFENSNNEYFSEENIHTYTYDNPRYQSKHTWYCYVQDIK